MYCCEGEQANSLCLFVVKAISNRLFWLKNCWRFERAQRVYLRQTLSFRKKCPYFVLAEDRRNFLRVQQSNIFESPSLFSPFTSSVQYWGIRHSYCFPLYIKYIKRTYKIPSYGLFELNQKGKQFISLRSVTPKNWIKLPTFNLLVILIIDLYWPLYEHKALRSNNKTVFRNATSVDRSLLT